MKGKLLVKICGVTSEDDVAACVAAGVDAIGINLWPGSIRFLERDRARAVAAAIPAGTLRVGVFVDAEPRAVADAMADLRLDRAQLHGAERPDAWGAFDPANLIRAVRVKDERSLEEAALWSCGLILYDAFVDGYGGGGVRAPWTIIARGARRPFLLAGGLSHDNVAEAVQLSRPDGVDVASGVESVPGRKDPARIRAFVEAARAEAARAAAGAP